MTKEEHKKLGIEYFNKTWDLIDKKDKTLGDRMQMIHYSHSSRLHWELSGAPLLNIVRGDWQISHVYSILDMGESALYHAQFVYDMTLKNEYKDFDLVFAYEAMAYAYKVLGDRILMKEYLDKGYESIKQVSTTDDKTYCKSQLDIILEQ